MTNPLTRKLVNNSPVDDDAIMLNISECKNLLTCAGFKNISGKYIVFFPKQLAGLRFLDKFISRIPLGAQHMTCGGK
ncbi:MAG: hypothetical protein IJT21_11325 [Synergistaceae bacterium]|nr:hypothetical protein [Synergistaceae bacterium]